MATLCSHSAKLHLLRSGDESELGLITKSSGMQRMLSWVTVLTAEFVVRTAGDDRVEDELARFGAPSNSD